MVIEGNRFEWYESRCVAEPAGGNQGRWILKMACRGEGQTWRKTTRLSMPSPQRLVMENAPVGPTTAQAYVRCSR